MTEVLVIRHGQCELNAAGRLNGRLDSGLTAVGREQAVALAHSGLLSELLPTPDAVYASPLARAFDTGVIVTTQLGLPSPQRREVLVERHLGVVTGMSIAGALAAVPDKHKIATPHGVTYSESVDHGFETFAEATERAKAFLEEVRKRHIGGRAWLFTHGDIGLAFVAAWTERPMREVVQELYLPNTGVVHLTGDGAAADYRKLDAAD